MQVFSKDDLNAAYEDVKRHRAEEQLLVMQKLASRAATGKSPPNGPRNLVVSSRPTAVSSPDSSASPQRTSCESGACCFDAINGSVQPLPLPSPEVKGLSPPDHVTSANGSHHSVNVPEHYAIVSPLLESHSPSNSDSPPALPPADPRHVKEPHPPPATGILGMLCSPRQSLGRATSSPLMQRKAVVSPRTSHRIAAKVTAAQSTTGDNFRSSYGNMRVNSSSYDSADTQIPVFSLSEEPPTATARSSIGSRSQPATTPVQAGTTGAAALSKDDFIMAVRSWF